MALTKQAKSALNATIIGHEGQAGVVLESGLIKTAKGLIARPSTESADTRTGTLADVVEVPNAQQTEIAEPVVKATRGRSKARSKAKEEEASVKVEFEIPGVGIFPSQYTHCYIGVGVIVLGLNSLSYVPTKAAFDQDGNMTGILKVSQLPDNRYAYLGNTFTDSNGVRNIILAEYKEEGEE